jgi:acyl-coenzyme A synthetase/AMP-(fatty) acid ligase
MLSKSPFPQLDIPRTNILSYLFPKGGEDDDNPLWFNAENTASALSPKRLLTFIKSVASGFSTLGVKPGDVVAVFTPNHIYVPVIYLATVGYGAIFTGFNPAYTVGELVHLIGNSEAKVIFVHPTLLKTAREAAHKVGLPESRLLCFSDTKEGNEVQGHKDWRSCFGSPGKVTSWKWDDYDSGTAERSVATINYSSG